MRWLTSLTALVPFWESQISNHTVAESDPVVFRLMRGVHANWKSSANSWLLMASMTSTGRMGLGPFIYGTPTIFKADLDWGRTASILSLLAPRAFPVHSLRVLRSLSVATLLQKARMPPSRGWSTTDSTRSLDWALTRPRLRVSTVFWEKKSPRLSSAGTIRKTFFQEGPLEVVGRGFLAGGGEGWDGVVPVGRPARTICISWSVDRSLKSLAKSTRDVASAGERPGARAGLGLALALSA